VLERNYSSQQTEGNKRGQQGEYLRCAQLATELVLGLKLQESYTSLSLLLTTLKRLSSAQHTAPTNHQDKKESTGPKTEIEFYSLQWYLG
jgi:hypothetical protein